MASPECDAKYLSMMNVGFNEPPVIVWGSGGCQGVRLDLQAGEYEDLQRQMQAPGRNSAYTGITGMWVPPHLTVSAYSDVNYLANGPNDIITGALSNPNKEPGFYPDLSNPRRFNIGANQIKSMQINRMEKYDEDIEDYRTVRWDEFKLMCCSGKVANGVTKEMCGPYWGRGTDKSGECDELLRTYCAYPPRSDSKLCSCYTRPDALFPNDTSEMKVIRRLPMCYNKNCSLYGYMPTKTLDGLSTDSLDCPPVTVCYTSVKDLQNMSTTVTVRDCNKIGSPVLTGGGAGAVQPSDPVPTAPDNTTTPTTSPSPTSTTTPASGTPDSTSPTPAPAPKPSVEIKPINTTSTNTAKDTSVLGLMEEHPFVVLFILIVAVVVIYLLLSRDSSDNNEQYLNYPVPNYPAYYPQPPQQAYSV